MGDRTDRPLEVTRVTVTFGNTCRFGDPRRSHRSGRRRLLHRRLTLACGSGHSGAQTKRRRGYEGTFGRVLGTVAVIRSSPTRRISLRGTDSVPPWRAGLATQRFGPDASPDRSPST